MIRIPSKALAKWSFLIVLAQASPSEVKQTQFGHLFHLAPIVPHILAV
jgi:hypothetical protein